MLRNVPDNSWYATYTIITVVSTRYLFHRVQDCANLVAEDEPQRRSPFDVAPYIQVRRWMRDLNERRGFGEGFVVVWDRTRMQERRQ